MTAFAVRLKEFADKTNRRADDIVRGVTEDIATKLIERSPVGDPSLWQKPAPKGYKPGTFRGNWLLGVGSIPQGESGHLDPDGVGTLFTMVGAIGEHPAGTIIYMVNNTIYARPIEDGHSTQAPTGLVGLTALEFNDSVNTVAARLAA